MKDYSKVKEAEKLLIESGVDYILAHENEDKKGFFVEGGLSLRKFHFAIISMVSGCAEEAKKMGIPEEDFGLKTANAAILGVKYGYRDSTEEVN